MLEFLIKNEENEMFWFINCHNLGLAGRHFLFDNNTSSCLIESFVMHIVEGAPGNGKEIPAASDFLMEKQIVRETRSSCLE